MKKYILFFILIYVNLFSFYLSTEKSFSPDENAKIKIESSYESLVNVRLYKIDEEEVFLSSAKELDRIYFGDENIKNNPTFLLFNYLNKVKGWTRELGNRIFQKYEVLNEVKSKNLEILAKKYYPDKKVFEKLNYPIVKELTLDLKTNMSSWSYSMIDFGKLSSGLYLAEVFGEDSIAYTLILVSENALVVKKSDENLFMIMVNKKTGEIIPAEFEIFNYRTGRKISNGESLVDKPFIYSYKKEDVSDFLIFGKTKGKKKEKVFTKFSVFPSPDVERIVYIYTDAPVYKTGSIVNFKVLVRDYKDGGYYIPKLDNLKISIVDPHGYEREIEGNYSLSDDGFILSSYSIPKNSYRGIYKILCKIGDKKYIGEFRVEDYVAPAFSVDVTTPKSVIIKSAEKFTFTVRAKYYTGEVIKNANVEYAIFRTPMSEDIFETSKDVFEDPSYAGRIEFVASGKGKFNSKGEFNGSYDLKDLDRDYIYIVRARVIDESFSQNTGSVKIRVVDSNLFLKAVFSKSVYKVGENVNLKVMAKTVEGKKVSGQKIYYKAMIEEVMNIAEGEVVTDKDGYAYISFKAKGKGYLTVTIFGKDKEGNEASYTVSSWIGADGATYAYTSGNLIIVFDKEEYEVGEKANVFIVSPFSDAIALLTSERESIMDYKVLKMKGNSALIEIPIKSNYTPNFFFSVLMFVNNEIIQQTVKVKVPPKEKVLTINIKGEDEIYSPRSEGKFNLAVVDSKGKGVEADVSIAVVNEGLYSLFPEIMPDPRAFFYSYRWNRVVTFNSIESRFYGYSKNFREDWSLRMYNKKYWSFNDLRRNRYFTGVKEGEETLTEEDSMVRKDFRDVALWIGSLKTDKNGLASFKITFPDNVGEFRITAVAFTKDTKVGKNSIKVISKRDLFVTFNMPPNLIVYDKAKGYLKIANSTDKNENVKLDVNVVGGKVELSKKEINVPAKGSVIVPFSIEPANIGKMKIGVVATGIKTKDAVEETINVLPATFPIVSSESKTFSKGSAVFNIKIPDNVLKDSFVGKIEIVEVLNPLKSILEALEYLKTYPHGCVEQTTSSFLPSLYAMESANKIKMKLPKSFEADKDKILTEGVRKLSSYQNSDGSWGWFGEGKVDTFMTAYVMSALNFVRRNYRSYLDNGMYYRGVSALSRAIENEYSIDLKIYGLYVLSEANVKVTTQLRNLFDNYKNLEPYSLSLLAIACKNAGLDKEALEVVNYLEKIAKEDKEVAYWSGKGISWYENNVFITANVLRAFVRIKSDNVIIPKILNYLYREKKNLRWGSTITTANVVYAFSEYVNYVGVGKVKGALEIYLNNEKLTSFEILDDELKSVYFIPAEKLKQGMNSIKISSTDSQNYLCSVLVKYNIAGLNQPILKNKMYIKRTFYKVDGKNLIKLEGNEKLNPMDVVLVELETKADKETKFVVIEDGIPAGFRPVYELNAYNNLGVKFFDGTVHHEFANGKANLYLDPISVNSKKYYYLIQAVYPGKYVAFSPYLYAMYNEEMNASDKVYEFEILEK